MAQDFAKTRKVGKTVKKTPAGAASRNNPQESRHWSWYFSGLFSGVLLCVIGFFAYYNVDNTATPQETFLIQDNSDEISDSGTELEFYEYLPQAEVEVNVVPVEIADANDVLESNPIVYLLQAGSFQDPNDAEELRARIILLNLDARVQSVSLSGRTWYRVQAGPFEGSNDVDSAENILINNNIDPIRLRVPSP